MQTLKMDPKFLKSVCRELKTATTRKGVRTYAIGPAQLSFEDKMLVNVFVTSVEVKPFESLGLIHAHRSNHDTPAELKASLREFYPDIEGEDLVTHVQFSIKPPKGSGYEEKLTLAERAELVKEIGESYRDTEDYKVSRNTLQAFGEQIASEVSDLDLMRLYHTDVLQVFDSEKCEREGCWLCKDTTTA